VGKFIVSFLVFGGGGVGGVLLLLKLM
jgi:hypothetical protein